MDVLLLLSRIDFGLNHGHIDCYEIVKCLSQKINYEKYLDTGRFYIDIDCFQPFFRKPDSYFIYRGHYTCHYIFWTVNPIGGVGVSILFYGIIFLVKFY